MLPYIEGEFRAVADPVLKFSPAGMAYCQIRAVADKKKKNDATGEWEDDKIIWVNITGFGKTAENMAESVQKGYLMQVKGQVSTREYEKSDGGKGFSVDIAASSVGMSLAFDPVTVNKADRTQGGGQQASTPAPDPWSTAPQGQQDPPF